MHDEAVPSKQNVISVRKNPRAFAGGEVNLPIPLFRGDAFVGMRSWGRPRDPLTADGQPAADAGWWAGTARNVGCRSSTDVVARARRMWAKEPPGIYESACTPERGRFWATIHPVLVRNRAFSGGTTEPRPAGRVDVVALTLNTTLLAPCLTADRVVFGRLPAGCAGAGGTTNTDYGNRNREVV